MVVKLFSSKKDEISELQVTNVVQRQAICDRRQHFLLYLTLLV